MIADEGRKQRQKAKVRRDLTALARRGDLNLATFEPLVQDYDHEHWPYARRYAKRLLALFRTSVFSTYEVAGSKWSQIEGRAKNVWYTAEGQLMPRYLHKLEAEAREATRLPTKRERPRCTAICRDGHPCRAKALPNATLCFKHSRSTSTDE